MVTEIYRIAKNLKKKSNALSFIALAFAFPNGGMANDAVTIAYQ